MSGQQNAPFRLLRQVSLWMLCGAIVAFTLAMLYYQPERVTDRRPTVIPTRSGRA